jgi:hypothetical protein
VQVGDLVKRWMPSDGGFYHILKMYRNNFGAPRVQILCLFSGEIFHNVRPSHVKVLR